MNSVKAWWRVAAAGRTSAGAYSHAASASVSLGYERAHGSKLTLRPNDKRISNEQAIASNGYRS